MFLGAGLTAGLAWDGRSAAVSALAVFLGSLVAFLSIAPVLLFSFWGLVSSAVVLDPPLPSGFRLERVRYGRLFRFLGLGCRSGKGFPCPGLFVTLGPGAALVGRPWQGEGELEGIPYCPLGRGKDRLGNSISTDKRWNPVWRGANRPRRW